MPFENLLKGFRQFQSEYFNKDKGLYNRLVKNGQNPEALVIACSDSRNDPALLTRSEPGDIFVVRNVAAIVPPYGPDGKYHGTSAAIEFAVKGLRVKNIVVLGHAQCGGVRQLATGGVDSQSFEFLDHWIAIGAAARDAVMAEMGDADENLRLRALEQAVIMTSLNNLMTFPWIRADVESGHTTLHGWYFDMLEGKMLAFDFEKGYFVDAPSEALELAALNSQDACCRQLHFDTILKRAAQG